MYLAAHGQFDPLMCLMPKPKTYLSMLVQIPEDWHGVSRCNSETRKKKKFPSYLGEASFGYHSGQVFPTSFQFTIPPWNKLKIPLFSSITTTWLSRSAENFCDTHFSLYIPLTPKGAGCVPSHVARMGSSATYGCSRSIAQNEGAPCWACEAMVSGLG